MWIPISRSIQPRPGSTDPASGPRRAPPHPRIALKTQNIGRSWEKRGEKTWEPTIDTRQGVFFCFCSSLLLLFFPSLALLASGTWCPRCHQTDRAWHRQVCLRSRLATAPSWNLGTVRSSPFESHNLMSGLDWTAQETVEPSPLSVPLLLQSRTVLHCNQMSLRTHT